MSIWADPTSVMAFESYIFIGMPIENHVIDFRNQLL